MTIETFRTLLELGWPALVTVGFGYLSIRYLADMKNQIEYLRKRIDELEARQNDVEKTVVAVISKTAAEP